MRKTHLPMLLWILALLILPIAATQAATLQELFQQERVVLRTWLDSDKVAAKQQVVLNIEVATDTWFLGGSRIGGFEVENSLVLRRQKLATNFTDRRHGKTWSVQQFEVTIYPQISGEFVVPPIAVELTVAGDSREKVSGTVLTQPMRFSASLPSPLITQDTLWVVATDYKLDVQYSTPPGDALKVGDALELTIRQNADNTTGMLLPQFEVADSPLAKAYPAPSELEDRQNRGHYRTSRTEKITYMVRNGGHMTLPGIEVLWWDPVRQQLEKVPLPGAEWQVKHTPMSWVKAHWHYFVWFGVLLVILWLLKRIIVRLPRPEVYDFARALWRHDRADARRLLYRRYRRNQQSLVLPVGHEADAWRKGEFGLNEKDATARQYWRLWWQTGSGFNSTKIWSFKPALPALQKDRHGSN